MLMLALLGSYAAAMFFVGIMARRQRRELGAWVHLHDTDDRQRNFVGRL